MLRHSPLLLLPSSRSQLVQIVAFDQFLMLGVKVIGEVLFGEWSGLLSLPAPPDEEVGHDLLLGLLVNLRLQLDLQSRDGQLRAQVQDGLPHAPIFHGDDRTTNRTVLPDCAKLTIKVCRLTPRVILPPLLVYLRLSLYFFRALALVFTFASALALAFLAVLSFLALCTVLLWCRRLRARGPLLFFLFFRRSLGSLFALTFAFFALAFFLSLTFLALAFLASF
mmetsp:Transcript_141820/g.246955  ORF Transcript_141820/g.246955 Transcript_141820/m.246955 type:complete len:223 (-) Transcript_141820:300-968(-)